MIMSINLFIIKNYRNRNTPSPPPLRAIFVISSSDGSVMELTDSGQTEVCYFRAFLYIKDIIL